MGTFLWGGLGLWLALNGVVAVRLIRRSNRTEEDLRETIVLPIRHST